MKIGMSFHDAKTARDLVTTQTPLWAALVISKRGGWLVLVETDEPRDEYVRLFSALADVEKFLATLPRQM